MLSMCRINYSDIEKLCIQKAESIETSLFYKHSHAQANCVKMLLEIMSHMSEKHKVAYESVKDITFSKWVHIVRDTGLIKEFTDREVREVDKPEPGVFVFWEFQPGLVWYVGLAINNLEMYYLSLAEKRFMKCSISEKKPVFFGVL